MDMSEQGLKFILNHKSYAHVRNVNEKASFWISLTFARLLDSRKVA